MRNLQRVVSKKILGKKKKKKKKKKKESRVILRKDQERIFSCKKLRQAHPRKIA